MSLNYASFVSGLSNLMGQTLTTDPNFLTMVPNAIDYAELRIYRDLDMLEAVTRDASKNLTINSRNFTLPLTQGTFVVVDGINLIVGGTRVAPLLPVSREFLDLVYPSDTPIASPSYPAFFAMISDQNVIVGPPPDGMYALEIVGRVRPTALSASNVSTILTTNFPDMFLIAAMVYAAGYMKNYGAQSDDPRASSSWEAQYQILLASAQTEQVRKRFASTSWSSKRTEQAPAPARPE